MTKPTSFTKTMVGAQTVAAGMLTEGDNQESSLAIGEIIQGVFKVERFVASGGMGQVFQARDLRLERPVAVKVLHGQFQEAEGLQRFQREARSLSRVVHPNVVATYEVGFHENNPFLVMEYVDGPTLGKHVRSRGSLPRDEAIKLTTQIAAGLEEAHALGIIHRDVKPGNILLHRLRAGGLLAKVVDFGLAVALEDAASDLGVTQNRRHEIVGSPLYMSPEQVRGEELTGASDQYSLAVVLFEMLTGKPPFVGDSLNAIFDRHLTAEIPVMELGSSDYETQRLNAIVTRAMAKKKEERFGSISEFMAALKDLVGDDQELIGEIHSCHVCDTRIHKNFGFCRGCGTPVPMNACRVCGTKRVGKRYHCIQCSASLLTRPGHRSSLLAQDQTSAVEEDIITSLGVVVTMEAVSQTLASKDWNWMAEQFRTSVEREHGHMVAIMGTEAFAYFGMGGLKEREVERAIDASLFAMDLIKRELQEVIEARELQVSIGVELGAIDAAETGMSWGTARMTGPGVQTVRRLTREATETGVFVGPNVWREVRSLYESTSLNGIQCLQNRRRVAILREASTIAGKQVPFVGRSYEVEHLERAFKRMVSNRKLVVVPVIGTAGIGKSRLLSEFLKLLNQRSEHCEVDVSHCIPSNEGVPFAPFRSSFRNRYRLHGEDDPTTVRSLLRHLPGVRDLPEHVGQQRVNHLSSLLGLGETPSESTPDEPWKSPSDPTQELAFEAYCEYIRAMAEDTPYVLAMDDLHWMRPSSAKLLSYLSLHCEDKPILIILTVRQKDAHDLLGSLNLSIPTVRSIELDVLSAEDLQSLTSQLFGEGVLDSRFLSTLYELSNGIPQELEGHLEALVDGGILRDTEQGWVLESKTETESSALPRSLRELVHQRLVRLGPEEQRILRAAALAGPSFSVDLLSAMVDRILDNREVDVLVSGGWLLESDAGDFPRSRELSFRQDRVRDTILEMLGEEASEHLHRKAANWLCRGDSSVHPSARTARLAKHHSASGNIREAARFTLKQARECDRLFAGQEAFTAYGEVMELLVRHLNDSPTKEDIDWFIEASLGRAHQGWLQGNHEPAVSALLELDLYLKKERLPQQWCRQQYLLAELDRIQERSEEAINRLTTASLVAMKHELWGMAAQLKGLLLFTTGLRGNIEDAETLAHEILQMETPDLHNNRLWNIGAGSATGFLARLASRQRKFDLAREHYRSAMTFREKAEDPVGTWMAKMGEGTVFFFEEKWTEAEAVYEKVAQELQDLGYRLGTAQAHVNLAEAKLMLKKPGETLPLLKEAEVTLRAVKAHSSLVELLRCRGEAYFQLNRHEEALDTVEQALFITKENDLEQALPGLEELRRKVGTNSAS